MDGIRNMNTSDNKQHINRGINDLASRTSSSSSPAKMSYATSLVQPTQSQQGLPAGYSATNLAAPRMAQMNFPNSGVAGFPFNYLSLPQRGQPFQGNVMLPPQQQQVMMDPRRMHVSSASGSWGNPRMLQPMPIHGVMHQMYDSQYAMSAAMHGAVDHRKRVMPSSSTELASHASDVSDPALHDEVSAPKKVKKARKPESDEGNLNGEQRLMIVFDSFGRLTKYPQKMGRKQGFIPDGVSGTFSMYGESWGFEVKHEQVVKCEDGEERVCIRWTVSNKVSGITHSVVETPSDAMKRDIRGVSLCNKVFVQAMELRAREYEALVEKEKSSETPNMLKVSNYKSRAQCLRPQRFSEGPLLFGLRHKCVQDSMAMD